MKISISHAESLERIARNVFKCERGGVGQIVDASSFELYPMSAATLCIGRLYKTKYDNDIKIFIDKWEYIFDHPEQSEDKLAAPTLRNWNLLFPKCLLIRNNKSPGEIRG